MRDGEGHVLQWVITTLDPNKFFSRKGDSGSVIFDLDGGMGGIIDGGSGSNYPQFDLTYATSMEWILEHIEANMAPVTIL